MQNSSDEIHQLINKIETVRDTFINDKVRVTAIYSSIDPIYDARFTAYSKLINTLNYAQLALTFISKHLLHKEWWKAISRNTISDSDKEIYIKEFLVFTKISFVQGLFMGIESSLRIYLRALDLVACNSGMAEFKSIYECLFKNNLSTIPTDGIYLLDLLRLTRNTVHNNGVYFHPSGNDTSINWNGETYEFKQGTPIDFVTWEFMIRVSDALRQLLNDVVEDTNIKGISEIINDPFLD